VEQIRRSGATGEARIARVGVDLAKRVMQVHAADGAGRGVCRRTLAREKFVPWCARLPAGCVVAMEMSAGAHHLARRLQALGLQPRHAPPPPPLQPCARRSGRRRIHQLTEGGRRSLLCGRDPKDCAEMADAFAMLTAATPTRWCCLTFEFTRLRKRAKPAVAGRVQRRVSPHGEHSVALPAWCHQAQRTCVTPARQQSLHAHRTEPHARSRR
jgi:hypothetical protein